MKIDRKDFSNLLCTVMIRFPLFFATILLSVSCASLPWRMNHPELAQRPATSQEQQWSSIIQDSYSKWNQPVLPVEHNETDGRVSPPVYRLPPAAAPAETRHKVRVRARDDRAAGSNAAPVINGPFSPDSNRLPAPIFDFDHAGGASPADTTVFRIVPEHAASGTIADGARNYVVQKGETLMQIAEKHYGDARQWRRLFDANRHILSNPDTLSPGMSLRIP